MDWKWVQLTAGIVLGLFGWTIYWLGLQFTGGVIGLALGAGGGGLAALLLHLPRDGMLATVSVGAVAGLAAGVMLSRAAHKFLFFFAGAVAASMAVHGGILLARKAGWGELLPWAGVLLRIVACLLAGALAVKFSKYIMSVLSAAAGTALILAAFQFQYAAVAVAPLFALFFAVQSRFLKRLPNPEDHWEDSS